jgi:excisionase family DNA binding protein
MADDTVSITEEQLLRLLRSPRVASALRPPSPWMRPEEAADYIGIALGTLRNWTSSELIPHSKKGRVVRYHRDTIDRWLSRSGCCGV